MSNTLQTTPQSETPARRSWIGLTALGLLGACNVRAQMGGGMGGGPMGGRGGPSEGAKCSTLPVEPVSSTLIKIYAEERLRSLPDELKLGPELLPLYQRYVQAMQQLMLDEGKWSARTPNTQTSPLVRIGAQIDLNNNRAAVWEEVLDAVKPLYARLDKNQQAIADQRLVVSLEPNAWVLPASERSGTSPRPQDGAPPKR